MRRVAMRRLRRFLVLDVVTLKRELKPVGHHCAQVVKILALRAAFQIVGDSDKPIAIFEYFEFIRSGYHMCLFLAQSGFL